MRIRNFGRNVNFLPTNYYEPTNESELIEILEKHRQGNIRVVASRHSWSDLIKTDDTLISMKNFHDVEIIRQGEKCVARVGAGCQIKHLLAELQKHGLTIPSIGLITEQTIAGATATGTHGSGKQCLSHFIQSARLACLCNKSQATIETIHEGDELRAVRCSLGCMGVVVSVDIPCVEQYNVLERITSYKTIEEVLAGEHDWPLQQFFFLPHKWTYLVQQRVKVDSSKSWAAPFYRLYWWLGLDLLFHLILLLFAVVCRSRRLIHFLFKFLLPVFVLRNWKVVDRSDKMLVMEHETFRHLELEAFVKKEHVVEASHLVKLILENADGSLKEETGNELLAKLKSNRLLDDFQKLKGTFTHHYPICFRRILRDDTLISMASGDSDWWYSISFITYVPNREAFYKVATFIAKSFLVLFEGRIHWGKWFPLGSEANSSEESEPANEIAQMYPELNTFREICSRFDPDQVFQNQFTRIICQPTSGGKQASEEAAQL